MTRTPYDAIADWPTFLHEVIDTPGSHPELAEIQPEATTPAAILGALYGVLGPFARSAMADAAIGIVETGTQAQARSVMTIGLEVAPDAAARIGAILQARRAVFEDTTVDGLIDRALQQDPHAPALVSAIEHEARTRGWRMLHLMAPARPDWVAAHLDLVPADVDPDGRKLARIVDRTKSEDLPALIDAIARAGDVARLQNGMTGWPDKARERVRPALDANPAFRP